MFDILETGLPGCLELVPQIFRDDRGAFVKMFQRDWFAAHGLCTECADEFYSYSREGVLRGLHFQEPPADQVKVVQCVAGQVMDAAVDLRVGSPTFGRHFSVELAADNFQRLFVPRGFAHGYVTLEPDTEFLYKVDAPYAPESDAGILWNDPDLGIAWPDCEPVLSAKDRFLPRLKDFATPFVFEAPAAGPAASTPL